MELPMNRLASETSPYLRQHAHNPVDWFPWGPDALARARQLDRPIFLSVGYSACHWCHVMERESFDDAATAALLNEHFVPVKVDREERPDLDALYMTALQAMTGEGGGWPLSVFLAPDLRPFYAGTYFPPDDRYQAHGRPSFKNLLRDIAHAWRTQRDRIREVGTNVVAELQRLGGLRDDTADVSSELLSSALKLLKQFHDPVYGGFGSQPKFPHALELRLLLRLADRFNDPTARDIATFTLTRMARGGIYDHLGGGFARYSTDAKWLVPHFEKMLYDNALLARAYTEAFQATGDPFFRQVVVETLEYVRAEMTSPEGPFFSTQDADSEGEEGKFYVWTADELRAALGTEDAEFACRVWGATKYGNFEGKNVLFRALSDEDEAKSLGITLDEFRARLTRVTRALFQARERRVRPGRDEKVITAWNGLMIGAMAAAGAALGEPQFTATARRAAEYVLANMRTADGRLFRTAAVGQPPKLAGYLEDHAAIADALVDLYEATFEPKWLSAASELGERILRHFADPNGPGFFFVADDHEELVARTKDLHDGSTPSGSALAVTALLRLAALTGRSDFASAAGRALRAYRGLMAEHPAASGQMLAALDSFLGPVQQVAIVGPADDEDTRTAVAAIRRSFGPRRAVAFHDPASGPPPAELATLFADKEAVGGAVTVYVCENFACRAPLVGAEIVVHCFEPPYERK